MIDFNDLFKGKYAFQRQVTGLFPDVLSFEGQAVFKQISPSRQTYEEFGSYLHNNQVIEFQTSYIYEIISPQHCQVLFPDGRLFYELFQNPQDIQHICGHDHYQGYFEVLSQNEWQLSWGIKGPRKDLKILTSYHRESML